MQRTPSHSGQCNGSIQTNGVVVDLKQRGIALRHCTKIRMTHHVVFHEKTFSQFLVLMRRMSFCQHTVMPMQLAFFPTRERAPSPHPPKAAGIKHSLQEKLRVASLAENQGFICQVACQEGHSHHNLCRWLDQKDDLMQKIAALKRHKKTHDCHLNCNNASISLARS